MASISIIIVNYRVKYFLEQTLRSALEALDGFDSEIIVVDNLSGDDSISFSRERYPMVKFVENTENVGFARANNQAIAMAQGEFALILNPDTIITHECLRQCVEWMCTHENCCACGVRMVDGNGVFLPESKRSFPTPWVSFCKIFGLSSLFPRSRFFAKYHLRYLSDREPHDVDILSGAFMFCRTALLKEVGGFDEDFFMYGEDIDLSYRITLAGYRNWFLPVEIVHYKGESTKKDSMRYVRIFYDAMLIFYRKHFPRFRVVMYPLIKMGVWVRAAAAMAKRAIKRIFGKKKKTNLLCDNVVILSDNCEAVAKTLGIEKYAEHIGCVPTSVIIDDGCHSYADIVNLISQHSGKGIDYHIFARRDNHLISPKMQQQ